MAITSVEYLNFEDAFAFFNQELFNNKLLPCLITLQRKPGSEGFFSAHGFKSRVDQAHTDEIALNPDRFKGRSDMEILGVLVHQMTHQYQHLYGSPGRGGYHNHEWAEMMIERGFIVVSDKPGGGQTGDMVSHYIKPGGRFQQAGEKLLGGGFRLGWNSRDKKNLTTAKNDNPGNGRRKFTCPTCGQNAWAKATAELICGACHKKNPTDVLHMIIAQ